MAVASAGPYASLHLARDRLPCQHPTTQFFTGRMPFLTPSQHRQSTEGTLSASQHTDKHSSADKPTPAPSLAVMRPLATSTVATGSSVVC